MKRSLFIILLGLTLTACGGGDSETSEAPNPPAPQNSGNGNGNGSGGNAPQNPALSLSCKPSPHLGTVEPGEQATATFQFSQSYNGAGSLLYGVQGEMANQENTFINGNQLVVTRTVPSEGKYSIRLNVNGTDLTAVCTWTIAQQMELAI